MVDEMTDSAREVLERVPQALAAFNSLMDNDLSIEDMPADAVEQIRTALTRQTELEKVAERMAAALKEIAQSKYQQYDGRMPYISDHSSGYALGVSDGHRYCARIADEPFKDYCNLAAAGGFG